MKPAMMLNLAVLMIFLGCEVNVPEKQIGSEKPFTYSGIWQQGHDLTEPRPKKSDLLAVRDGGVVIMPKGAGYYLTVSLKEPHDQPLYFKITWPNPLDKHMPMVNDLTLPSGDTQMNFSAPEYVKGLRIYKTYTIKVEVFDNPQHFGRPLDTLSQKLRSYVDSTGTYIKVYGRN